MQHVEITDDAGAGYAAYAKDNELAEADLVGAPYVLIGTVAEIKAKLRAVEERWGILRFAVRKAAVDAVAALY